jgi:hypothetical protein
MKKRRYRKSNKVHIRAPYRFRQREIHPEFKQFLAWYEEHQSEFKFKLHRFSENKMTIEGVNPIVKLCFALDFNVYVYWKGVYEELYSALACPQETEHGYYCNAAIMRKWQTVYFTEQALVECDVFEPIRDWINNKLPEYQWASFYEGKGGSGANFGAEKKDHIYSVGHIRIWLNNYKETKNDN